MNQYQSENTTELAKALLNMQCTAQPVTKDAENPFTKSWYASLNSVMDASRDALIENCIWLCQYPVPVGGSSTDLPNYVPTNGSASHSAVNAQKISSPSLTLFVKAS